MPTAKFIHDGASIDYRPETGVAAGDVVVLNDLVAVARLDIPVHTLGALAVKGVFEVPKPEVVVAAGSLLYWDPVNKVAVPSLVDESRILISDAGDARADGTYSQITAAEANALYDQGWTWAFATADETKIYGWSSSNSRLFIMVSDGSGGWNAAYTVAVTPDPGPTITPGFDFGTEPYPTMAWGDFPLIGKCVRDAGEDDGKILVRLTCHA